MVKTVKIAAINNGQILLCRKEDSWGLPGGKPEDGEDDLSCLLREISEEEISGTEFEILDHYRVVEGLSPHKRTPKEASVYFAQVRRLGVASGEIDEVRWICQSEISSYNLCEIALKTVLYLREDGYL